MALKLIAAQRVNPAPCRHFRLTVEEDGVERSFELNADDLRSTFEDFPGRHKGALILGWIRYRLEQGATLASLIDQVIA